MKKILLSLLALLLSLHVFAQDFTYTYAGQTLSYEVVDPTSKTCKVIKGEQLSGAVTIPQTAIYGGESYKVVGLGNSAFFNCSDLTSVSIPNTVTSIGASAFSGCTSITTVNIPGSVTSIGESAFYGCTSLTTVNIPNSVTSIGPRAFYGSGLTSIVLPSSLKAIEDHTFNFCEALTSVTIPNSVMSIGNSAFYECSSLTSVTIPNSVTTIEQNAFSRCRKITEFVIPNSVTSIGTNAFSGCSNLLSVTIGKSVQTIGFEIFIGCNQLESITCFAPKPPSCAGVFSSGSSIALYVPEGSVGDYEKAYAWKDCESIEPIVIAATGITLNKSALSLPYYSSEALIATVTPSDATDKVKWTSSNEAVATVSSTGVVIAVSVGSATITATCGSVSATCTVIVTAVAAKSVLLSPATLELKKGGSSTLTATVDPSTTTNKTITWKSSNEAVATVDANGKVTAKEVGEATITATCGSVSATCKVTVSPIEVTSVTVSLSRSEIKIGETSTLTPTVKPDNATYRTVTYTVDKDGVVEIEGNTVTGLKDGTVKITAKAGDKTATCEITVKPIPAESITIDPAEVELLIGAKSTLIATVSPENTTYKEVTWTSDKPTIASVNSTTGEVTAIAEGHAVITAKCGDVTETCVVTVKPILPTAVTVTAPKNEIMDHESLQLTATIEPTNATNQAVTWSSSDISVATVDNNGLLTAKKVGKVTITATSKASPTVKGSIQIKVLPRAATVDGIIYEIVYINPEGSSDGDYVKVTGGQPTNGVLTIQGTYTTSLGRKLTVKEVAANAFNGKSDITSIVIPASVMTVGEGAFANCANLKDVRIDNSKETLTCGDKMFENSPFVKLYLGRHTSGTVLSGHTSLVDLQIGPDVTEIDAKEFAGCAPITTLIVDAQIPPVMPENAFDTSVYENTVLRVPHNKIDEYRAAEGWKLFASIRSKNEVSATAIKLDTEDLTIIVGESHDFEVTFTPANVTSTDIVWSCSDESILSISSNGVVLALKPGKVTVTATTSNDISASCEVTVIPIKVTGVTVEPAVAEMKVGDVLGLSVSVEPEDATDQTVVWSSSEETIATVDTDGHVTALAPGPVTITATSPDGPSATCTLTVIAATVDVEEIILNVEKIELRVGAKRTLKAYIYPDEATDKTIRWSSSDPTVVAVDENGNLTALREGTVTIMARTHNDLKAECEVTVLPALVAATGITLNAAEIEMLQWESVKILATLTPAEADEAIEWSSSDEAVATVDESGNVTSISPGTAIITAKVASGASASCTIKVQAAPTGIGLDRSTASLLVGGELQLTATVDPAEAAGVKLTWQSGNPAIVTVDQTGKLKGIAPGETTVTVRTPNGLSVSCGVSVKAAPTSIALNFTHLELPEMERGYLIATVQPGNIIASDDVVWTSSDESVMNVFEGGLYNTFAPGTAIITATTVNGLTATCEVTVTGYDVRMNVLSATIYRGEQLPLTAKVSPDRGYYAGYSWSSSDPEIATVDDDGMVTGEAVGSTYINYYVGSTGFDYCPVTVIERNPEEEGPEVIFSEVAVRPGQSLDLSHGDNNGLTWTSSDESVIKVDENGHIVAVGEGEAEIVATDANGATTTCTVLVANRAPAPVEWISFNGDQTLTEGETLQLLPELYPANAFVKITYSSSDPEVVSVDENGVITALKPGVATITATTSNDLWATCLVTVEAKPSAIEEIGADGSVSVVADGGDIVVTGADRAEVYSLAGVRVAVVTDGRVSGLPHGVYIVRAGTQTFKIRL